MKSERGSALVLVLLMTVVFIVLGLALVSQVVTETNLSVSSEEEMQARNLAESGLVYFEEAVREYIQSEEPKIDDLESYINSYNADVIGTDGTTEQAKVVQATTSEDFKNDYKFYAESLGRVSGEDGKEVYLTGEFSLGVDYGFDFEDKTRVLATFSAGTKGVDVNKSGVEAGLVGPLLDADVLRLEADDESFYPLPADHDILHLEIDLSVANNLNKLRSIPILGPVLVGILEVSGLKALVEFVTGGLDELLRLLGLNDLLEKLATVNLGSQYDTYEKESVIAKQSGSLVDLDVLGSAVTIDLLTEEIEHPVNVTITGSSPTIELLGKTIIKNTHHIEFKKLAILGNANIHQDREGKINSDNANPRYFSFIEGLFVNKSLLIGKSNTEVSRLGLAGEMVAMEDFAMVNTDLTVGAIPGGKYDGRDTPERNMIVYIHGDAYIENSCIQVQDDYDFELIVGGKITFVNKTDGCESHPGYPGSSYYPGTYYAREGIEFITNNEPMVFEGPILSSRKEYSCTLKNPQDDEWHDGEGDCEDNVELLNTGDFCK